MGGEHNPTSSQEFNPLWYPELLISQLAASLCSPKGCKHHSSSVCINLLILPRQVTHVVFTTWCFRRTAITRGSTLAVSMSTSAKLKRSSKRWKRSWLKERFRSKISLKVKVKNKFHYIATSVFKLTTRIETPATLFPFWHKSFVFSWTLNRAHAARTPLLVPFCKSRLGDAWSKQHPAAIIAHTNWTQQHNNPIQAPAPRLKG